MQVEVKVALNFLLSFLYDKLPRRKVNLFGDELKKYLMLKFHPTSVADSTENASYLSINFKPCDIEPCIQIAAKDCVLDVQEILEYLPSRLRLFVKPSLVYYVIYTDSSNNEIQEMKIIYNDTNSSITSHSDSASLQSKETINEDELSLNFFNPISVKQTSPLGQTPFSGDYITSPFLTPSPSLSVLNNEELLINQINPWSIKEKNTTASKEKQLFTAASFAQTKFGSTKKKIINPNANANVATISSPRQLKQPNQKMHSNEFAAYIKNKSEVQTLKHWSTQDDAVSKEPNSVLQQQLLISNILKACALVNVKNENSNPPSLIEDNRWMTNKLEMNMGQSNKQQNQQSLSPVISPTFSSSSSSSSSSVSGFYDNSSRIDDIEETLNSYFSPTASLFSFQSAQPFKPFNNDKYSNMNA